MSSRPEMPVAARGGGVTMRKSIQSARGVTRGRFVCKPYTQTTRVVIRISGGGDLSWPAQSLGDRLMTERYDAIVIGAGQAGPALCARLDKEGLKTALKIGR